MPLASGGGRISNPFYRGALALFEFPEHEIVFEWIGTQRQVITVRLEIEQNPRSLIDTAGNSLKAHGNLAVTKIVYVLGHDIREISIGLHAVEKFGVALAVERASLVGKSGRGLPFLPLTSIDHKHLVVAVGLDPPDADNAQKRLRLGANGFIREVDFKGLCCDSEQQRCEQAGGCHGKCSDVFADCHGWPPFLTNCAGMRGARSLHHHTTAISRGRVTKNQGRAIHPSATRGYPG